MITSISIKNFKIFKDIRLRFSSLNLITGLNGMGKSSLIQSLLLLRQTRLQEKMFGALSLKGDLINLGRGRDILYQYADKELIEFEISFNNVPLRSTSKYDPEKEVLSSEKSDDPDNLNQYSLFNSNFQYLSADRLSPAFSYSKSSYTAVSQKQLGTHGEYTPHFLHVYGNREKVPPSLQYPSSTDSDTLLQQTNLWLSEITPGTRISTADFPGLDSIALHYQFRTSNDYTNAFAPPNVGFGLSYALPVIVALLTANKDKLIIIENPESHLHPQAQSRIGELIARAALTGAQLFIESHSDHVLNGMRLAIKKRLLEHHKASIFFFMKDSNATNDIVIKQPSIDEEGGIEYWPEDFFDQSNKDLKELLGFR